MNIQEKLNEIHTYIESKILKGEFEFLFQSDSELTSTLIVDDVELSIFTYSQCNSLSITNLGKYYEFKDNDGVKNMIKPLLDNYSKNVLIAEKEAELKKLKESLK